ncbi:glucose-6-phosphate exchanger SLC37A2-like isoform X2 [Homarus americanus]|uniref:glucose-6-phosphate exchanger SLC37A2-like isoform X2 n=1 Tax=Homarus americanus TaxID=6706 RepID=UPI001C470255|nr:glucose-6-phosphate exchanger SLC37A2-like isoform X2 [Homarus americanus]
MARLPLSIQAIESSCCVNVPSNKKKTLYSSWMWILTFFTYCSYHLSRKPISVVKNVLNQNCSGLVPPYETNNSHWCDWKPFDGEDSGILLGMVDSSFLFAYAGGMFVSGLVAERVDLRLFLSFGMILSGVFCGMFGLGYSFGIHSLWFYITAQVLCGLMQTTGWPGVVTALGNWFGKGKRGLIFGIWNSHTSVGNILGTLIAAAFVGTNWALSFIIPGIIIASVGVVVLFFMVPEPQMVGLPNPNTQKDPEGVSPPPRRRDMADVSVAPDDDDDESTALLDEDTPTVSYIEKDKKMESEQNVPNQKEDKAISFFGALSIPGVVEFSLCLFFAKLVSYTFLYWLPNYILNSTPYTAEQSANLSTFFDVGGIIGGILAGIISDHSGMSATTCSVMLIVAVPMMYIYRHVQHASYMVDVGLLLLVGTIVNGPYSLITTAVSADLGTHPILAGSAKALATVTAIIDGTGSIGAALGPLIAGRISELDWNYVFYMLMAADVLALILLTRLVTREIRHKWQQRRLRYHHPL